MNVGFYYGISPVRAAYNFIDTGKSQGTQDYISFDTTELNPIQRAKLLPFFDITKSSGAISVIENGKVKDFIGTPTFDELIDALVAYHKSQKMFQPEGLKKFNMTDADYTSFWLLYESGFPLTAYIFYASGKHLTK